MVAVHRLARVAIELSAYEQALGESEIKGGKRRELMRPKNRILSSPKSSLQVRQLPRYIMGGCEGGRLSGVGGGGWL